MLGTTERKPRPTFVPGVVWLSKRRNRASTKANPCRLPGSQNGTNACIDERPSFRPMLSPDS